MSFSFFRTGRCRDRVEAAPGRQGILEVSFISPLSSLRDSRILKSFFENVFDASINRRFNVFANQTSKGDIEVQTD